MRGPDFQRIPSPCLFFPSPNKPAARSFMTINSVYSVSRLTGLVRRSLEKVFPFVWVRGQVVNLSRPSSGHVYFSLADEGASLSAVWFRGGQRAGQAFDPMTGEVFDDGPRESLAGRLENGMEIVCAGALTVYEKRGVYQLVVEVAEEAGLSRLHREFEQMKARLRERGFFDQERKRLLPLNPERVAVVTSPVGAAIHDFLRLAQGRGFGASIRIYPSLVQGAEAERALAAQIEKVNADGWAQVLVLIRGGGSLEDLWAFNTEGVARAVFGSQLPVLAGIGHEVDFTLADLTADQRASTPSHAAQILWAERSGIANRLEAEALALDRSVRAFLQAKRERLSRLEGLVAGKNPLRRITDWSERLEGARERMKVAAARLSERAEARLDGFAARLSRFPGVLGGKEGEFAGLLRTLEFSGKQIIMRAEHSLEKALLRLSALDPHEPLERGYALVRRADGSFVKCRAMAKAGEMLDIVVKDGEIPVTVRGDDA